MRTPARVPAPRAVTALVLLVLGTLVHVAHAKPASDSATRADAKQFLTPDEVAKTTGDARPAAPKATISPPVTDGGCVYVPLTSTLSQTVTSTTNLSFAQATNYWCAVGIRPAPLDDWDLTVNDGTGAVPTCVSTQLAASVQGAGIVDFVVGDFNHNPQKTYWPQVYPYAAANPATVEWDDDSNLLAVNDYGTKRSTDASDVLECWDVFLEAGKTYTFSLGVTGATAASLFLFRNPANAPLWLPRSMAEFALAGTSIGASVTYTAPATDFYGVVVVNENGGTGTYAFRVDNCADPQALTSGATTLANRAPSPYSFNQVWHYWSAVGLRANDPSQDWNLQFWRNHLAGPAPGCYSSLIEDSFEPAGRVDLVVGDFNYNPLGVTQVSAIPAGLTNTDARIEWDDGPDLIFLDDPPLQLPTDVNDIVRIWDVQLLSGQTYHILFSPQSTTGGAAPNCWLLLFRNHNGAFAYWAPRQFADVQTQTSVDFTAPATGYYGIAVVHDDGGTGQYTVGVYHQGVAVPDAPRRFVTRLTGVLPNPVTSASRITFELAEPARVGFEVIDAAGRIRARIPDRAYEAGPANAAWDAGSRSVPGVYFLRMIVNGVPRGERRVLVL